jgi:non-homologous end joining protein Ku
MPASRPQWKGYLKLSLVSCPIAIYPAVSAAERISFRQINRNTGNRLRQQLVDAVTGETVDRSERAAATRLAKAASYPSRTRSWRSRVSRLKRGDPVR